MAEQLGKEIKKGFVWNFAEQISFKVMQFVIQIVLTRLLMPEDYGLVALSLAFVNFANVFVTAGFGSALIYKKDANSKDFSSVCWMSVGLSIAIYVVLFFSAPFIADFYSDDRIVAIVRIMSISLILGAFNSVQISLVQKNMQFKKSFVGHVLGVTISAALGIWTAVMGYGVWALVIQYISNRIVSTISFYVLNKWMPKLEFSWATIKELFAYSWKLMATNLLSTLSADIYALVIGKFFTKAQLGTYDTGTKIPANLGNTVATTMGTVLFPAFSKLQDDRSQIRTYMKKANQISSFIIFPFLYTIAAIATPLVSIVFTDKWLAAVPFLQVACFMYSLYPIHLANLQVAKSIGRTDLSMYMEIGKKVTDIILLILTVRLGLIYVSMGLALSGIIALWINIEPIKKYINYSTIEQIIDVLPSWTIGVLTAVASYLVGQFCELGNWGLLGVQSLIAIVVFSVLTFVFNRKILKTTLNQIKSILGK